MYGVLPLSATGIWHGREPISTPGRKGIAMDDRELTIAGLLADPMTLALMAADNVDPVELRAEWTALARKLALADTTERRPERSNSGRCRIELVNFSHDQIR